MEYFQKPLNWLRSQPSTKAKARIQILRTIDLYLYSPSYLKSTKERFLTNWNEFFQSKKLFYESQYGFRKNHSTEHAALELFDRVAKDVDDQNDPFAIYLDLSKAFDTIDHSIMIEKLHRYGIQGICLNWFKSYLSGRKQYVHFLDTKSDLMELQTGVPQGSILGPSKYMVSSQQTFIEHIKN